MRIPTALSLALLATAGCASAGPAAFTLHADDFDRVRGEYVLADGHAVHIVGTRQHPRIEFDDGRTAPLAPLSATAFATPDGCTRIDVLPAPNASVTRLGVTRTRGCATP